MKPRRTSKPRHKFKFTIRVDDVIFPKAIARKLSSSKFYILLSRADKNTQTEIGSIAKDGTLQFNGQEISIEATLFKNRNTNTYIPKHCRIVLRQIKNSSNHQNTKARESSVGSIKLDLVNYIERIPIDEQLLFSKCALQDVFIKCCIRSQEMETEHVLDDNMSVTSANTVRIDSFWLDMDDQKSSSPAYNHHKRYNHSEGHTDNEQEGQHHEDERSNCSVPIERKELSLVSLPQRLTDQNLIQFDGKQKEMAKFRIKRAMDVLANETNDDLYGMYEKEQKELSRARQRMEHLERQIQEKDIEIKHFHDEERKWNKTMIEWEREKTSFEASTIELNFKYQQVRQDHKECKQQLSEVTLSTKRIIAEKQKSERKYNNLVQSLSKDENQLMAHISHLQMEYDDLEESMVQQQNSFRKTGNIMQMDLDKHRRKTIKAMNELKKYKQRYDRLKPENVELHKKIEALQKEMFQMKSEHEIQMAQAKHDTEQQLRASERLVNELMMAQQVQKDQTLRDNHNTRNIPKNEPEIEEANKDIEVDEAIHNAEASKVAKSVSSHSSHSSHNVVANIRKFEKQRKDVKPRKRRKSGLRLKRNSVSHLYSEKENTKKLRTKPKKRNRSNSVKNMINKIEKEDEDMMKRIEQELLSPDEVNESDEDTQNEGNDRHRLTNVSDLTHISDILIKQKEDEEMEKGEPCHRHVRSSISVNMDTLQTLEDININDLMVTQKDGGSVSEDELSNLSGSGLDATKTETIIRNNKQEVVDID